MAEIIQFKGKVKEKPAEEKDEEIEIITDVVLSTTLDMLIRSGYNLEKDFDKILPSIILIKESITSLQLKLKGKEYFLQEFAEKSFIITDT